MSRREALALLASMGYRRMKPFGIKPFVQARLKRAPFGHVVICPQAPTERESLVALLEEATRP